jgi:hypothetical protein
VSDASPSRFAGPVALSAGVFVAVVDLGRLVFYRADPVAMLADPVYLVFNGLYFLAFPALLIALAAVHGRQAGIGDRRVGELSALRARLGVVRAGEPPRRCLPGRDLDPDGARGRRRLPGRAPALRGADRAGLRGARRMADPGGAQSPNA